MSRLVPLPQALAPVRDAHATLIEEACSWCGGRGATIDPDLVALVLAGVRPFDDEDASFTLWTRIGVRALMRCGIPNWCSMHSTTWPVEVVVAIWRWLDFLYDTGRMDPRSDPVWELRKPLICYGGLDFDGVRRPTGDPSPIPCECYLPYRESADHLNDQIRRGALAEDVLVWSPTDW